MGNLLNFKSMEQYINNELTEMWLISLKSLISWFQPCIFSPILEVGSTDWQSSSRHGSLRFLFQDFTEITRLEILVNYMQDNGKCKRYESNWFTFLKTFFSRQKLMRLSFRSRLKLTNWRPQSDQPLSLKRTNK